MNIKEREGYVADSNIDNIDVLLKNVEDNKVNMISSQIIIDLIMNYIKK